MSQHPIQILLVDDSDDDVLMVQEAMSSEDVVNIMDVVNDGEEAMAYLRRTGEYAQAPTPGLVLLDINMPKMNGFEVLEAMKADETLKKIPVVMLTTSDREEDIVKSFADGACSFITKPVTIEKLQEKIRQFSIYWAMVTQTPGESNQLTP